MIYKTTLKQKEILISKPESGMGYQFVELSNKLHFKNNKKGIVYNGSHFIEEGERFGYYQKQLFDNQLQLNSLNFTSLSEEFDTIKVLQVSDFIKNDNKSLFHEVPSDYNKTYGARESEIIYLADGLSQYARLSAFENDIRIDKVKKCLLPGSFATTFEDYVKLKDLKERPNERYALPNDETILYAFLIKPTISDSFQKGIVQPANGFKGGGVEVFFENGTSNGTFIKQLNYGRY